MKIYDTFLFYNEFDLLELRLEEHYNSVDKFVILEYDRTFTGISKPHILLSQKDRYKKWWDKVEYFPMTGGPVVDLNDYNSAWRNEYWQFDQMAAVWKELDVKPDDVVTVACVDELIRPETFKFFRSTEYLQYILLMPIFYYKFNFVGVPGYRVWPSALRGIHDTPRALRESLVNPAHKSITLHNSGWHFSYFGDEDWIRNKIKSYSHTENDVPQITENINVDELIASGKDIFNRTEITWYPVALNSYFPKTVLENKDKYKRYILENCDRDIHTMFPYRYSSIA